MKKAVVCIFAHPDDEAFCSAGTIAKLSQENDVYLLCATRGEAGENHHQDKDEDIRDIREEELFESSKILGIKKIYFLDFRDGTLNNNIYHELAHKIDEKINEIKPKILITFEPQGVSGHIDHIAISMISTYVFKRNQYPKEIWYCCNDKETAKRLNDRREYFIYFPSGYEISDIDKEVDISTTWEKKKASIKTHKSQKKDIENFLPVFEELPKKEYFLVKKK